MAWGYGIVRDRTMGIINVMIAALVAHMVIVVLYTFGVCFSDQFGPATARVVVLNIGVILLCLKIIENRIEDL